MQQRKLVILAVLVLLIIGGFAGLGLWRDHQREPAPIDTAEVPGCDPCATAKRDLAEQVRERQQQAKQGDVDSPESQ